MRYEFGAYVLDEEQRELHESGRPIKLEPKVFDLLAFLLRNRERVVGKDELLSAIWNDRVVTDSALSVAVNEMRKAVGDDGTRQQVIRTYPRRGFRFVAEAKADETPGSGATLPPPPAQQVRYCRTADGVSIAWTENGDGEPVVRLPTMFNHLDFDWQNPLRAPLLYALIPVCRQIRYDGRGTGLSDREVADISFDAFMADLDAVIRAAGIKRYALLGTSGGAPIAIAHAARNPREVTRLALHGAYAVGRLRRDNVSHAELAKADQSILRHGWGNEHSDYLRAYASRFMPNATPEQLRMIAEQQRAATSADIAVRLRDAWDDLDVSSLLSQIQAPTLVVHCRGDGIVPHAQAQSIASAIPNARLVTIESQCHIPFHTEPAWTPFVEAITGFLRG